jgi:hypothetical protein
VTTPRRDEALESYLRRAANRVALPATEDCLDPETAAAWADDGLDANTRASLEVHVADCVRCQTLLATVLATEGTTAETPATPVATTRRWMMWVAPLAAAAVLVIAAVVWSTTARQPVGTARQMAAREGPAASAPASPDPAPALPAERPAERERPEVPPTATSSETTPGAEERRRDRSEPAAKTRAADAAAADKSATAAPEAPVPSAPAASGLAETLGVAPPSPPPARPESLQRAPQVLADRVSQFAQSADIVSPDPSVRWRIRGALVEHSNDGGRTWTDAGPGTVPGLVAGFAPSAGVCWIVGRGGVVLVTSDNTSWMRHQLDPPVDLGGVVAQDARVATVTAVDGRTFSTADGGVTWTAGSR